MKDVLMQILKNLPKKSLLVAAVVMVSAVATFMVTSNGKALLGGDRPVKQYQGVGTAGFDHVTFNSFTDVPNIGDERDFFTGKISGAPDGFYDPMNGLRAGDEILMRVYVHNGADPKHNASGQGVAKNTRVRVTLPANVSQSHTANAFVSADNAVPLVVEDTLSMTGEYPISLDYVEGSATMKTNFVDVKLSDNIVKDGVLVGDDNLNGNMKGCFEYIALVTFKVKVKASSYTLDKKVRLNGGSTFTKEVAANPGDKVDYVLAFKNVGNTDLHNVVLGDRLPQGVTYVPGSTEWNSGHTNSQWVKAASDNITDGGVDVGAYAPNGSAFVRFTAQLPAEDKLKCGVNRLVNHGFAKPKDHGTIESTADVVVNKECEEEPEESLAECKLIDVNHQKNTRKVSVSVSTLTEGDAEAKSYVYDFGDGSEPLVTDKSAVDYEYDKDGTYNVVVKVNFEVDGENVNDVTSEDCEAIVKIKTDKPQVKPAKTLPKTGAGEVAGLFGSVSLAGAAWHRLYWSRRNR